MSLHIVFTQPQNSAYARNLVVLHTDNWDDYSYKTLFSARLYDSQGNQYDLGSVKIGYVNQPEGRTRDALTIPATELPDTFFSLGQDPDYYRKLMSVPADFRQEYLRAMRDLVADRAIEAAAQSQEVYSTSLLRTVSSSAIDGQFRRILAGGVPLTEYRFTYVSQFGDSSGPMQLAFDVVPNSLPPTNVHVIIGRNGVGKTTMLNSIVGTIVEQRPPEASGRMIASGRGFPMPLPPDYFSSVSSVAFSAFDPFTPPADRTDRTHGVSYFYIGLKRRAASAQQSDVALKPLSELADEFVNSLQVCLSMDMKRQHWRKAITALEFDENFAEMSLSQLADGLAPSQEVFGRARSLFGNMSSGHKIVLLTITKLVETVEEKSLVLLDEPESHLHPPLLSAFTRALSELLINRNAVAIIATHSPVIVQEVPRSCVWKIRRYRDATRAERPEIETFGENVGSLTREIFGLEVSKSGFHDMLEKATKQGTAFDDILESYDDQIGLEGQAVLRALLASRGA